MTKYELIYNIIKGNYDNALSRRDKLRNRINLTAGFGLTAIFLILSNILESINFKDLENNCFKIIILVIFICAFLGFIITYLLSFGVKTLVDSNSLYLVDNYHTLVNFEFKSQTLYFNQLEYYKEKGINNPELLAENDAIYQYESSELAVKTKNINKSNSRISLYFTIMNIILVINIVLLIIMKGAL